MLLFFNYFITKSIGAIPLLHIINRQDFSYCIGDNSIDLDKISNKTAQSHNHIMNSHICKLVNKYELHFQGVNFVNFKLFVSVLIEQGVPLD